jgi:hypothetical protein
MFYCLHIFAKKNTMFQRIQTAYFFIALAAAGLFFFFPFAKYFTPEGTYEFSVTGMRLVTDSSITTTMFPVLLLSLICIVSVLILFALLTFKNRIRQMRIVAVAFLLNAALIGTMFYLADKFETTFNTTTNYKNIGLLMPLIVLIFLLLANKAIRNDEIKMRKSNRIR